MAHITGTINDDTLTGGVDNDSIEGFAGDDAITGGGGNDTMRGGSGDDMLYIGGNNIGSDIYDGGDGYDTIRLTGDITTSSFRLTAANVIGTEHLSFLHYNLAGTSGNDVFNISGMADVSSYDYINMGDGNDSFTGYGGSDYATGGWGNDTLNGGAGNDFFAGNGGNDRLVGGTGDDTFFIQGNDSGYDIFKGDEGYDTIRLSGDITTSSFRLTAANVISTEHLSFLHYNLAGTSGNDAFDISGMADVSSYDYIQMNDGKDKFTGYRGSDYVNGGAGVDTLNGGAGDDYLVGGSGNDQLIGGTGDDTFYIGGNDFGLDIFNGGAGADRIRLTGDISVSALKLSGGRVTGTETLDFSGNDISGTGSNDVFDISGIRTVQGYDWIRMQDGSDTFIGYAGNDYVDGGAGNDRFVGGAGNDNLFGGTGRDTVDYRGATGGVRVELNVTAAQNIGGGQGTDTLTSIEVVLGSSSNDRLTGNGQANQLHGAGGADTLAGGKGNDLLNGGSGNDTVSYATAGGAITARLNVTGSQNVGGQQGSDQLVSIESLIGSRFADRLDGNGLANVLDGADGNDRLNGGSGNDRLNGGNGADQALGGSGNDQLNGQGGNDVLTGNSGSDRFIFDTNDGNDRITDWQDGSDTIVLRGGSWQGDRYDDFNDLTISQSGGNAVVSFGGTTITVLNTQANTLTSADFDFV